MLVLTRKNGESIVIDNRITVTVVRLTGNTVRLGIDAPVEVPIQRSEICDVPIGPAAEDDPADRLHECTIVS